MSTADVWEMQGPRCNSDEELSVVVQAWAALSEDGIDADSDHEWDGESPCKCRACGWIGTADDAGDAYERDPQNQDTAR